MRPTRALPCRRDRVSRSSAPTRRPPASSREPSIWTAPAVPFSRARADGLYALGVTIRGPRAVSGDVNAATPSLEVPRLTGRPGFAEVVAEQLDAVYRYLVY